MNLLLYLSYKFSTITIIFILAVNVLLSFAIADIIATKRVIGFWTSLIICLVASPIIGLLITVLSKTKEQQAIENNFYNKSTKLSSVADEILKLQSLKEKGIISSDEFEIQKQKIMNS